MMSVKIEGLSELTRKMKNLEPKLRSNALRAAANAGAQVIKKEAIALAPQDTGRLKKAIYVKRSRHESDMHRETYTIGVRTGRKEQEKNRDAYYWFLIEFGTKFKAAMPFLRPALESKQIEAINAVKNKILQRLEKVVKIA